MTTLLPIRSIAGLSSTDIAERLSATSIVCLPVGSVEQHGPHLPLGTDLILAREYTRRIVARWGEELDLWQLPAVPVSLAREHEWAGGTMSLSVETVVATLRDYGRSIARALPTRRLVIVNGHGGNRGILDAVIQDLRADFGLDVVVFHPAGWGEPDAQARVPDIHAGRTETAMMLAVAPDLVHLDRIATLTHPPAKDTVRAVVLDRHISVPWTSDDARIADRGVIGDAHRATAADGEAMLAAIGEMAGDYLKQFLARGRA